MRLPIRSLIPVALGGLLASNGSSASATRVDAASGLRASIGASLEELALGNSTGALVFLLNGIFCAAVLGARHCAHSPERPARKASFRRQGAKLAR
jgi:hypothetical protein